MLDNARDAHVARGQLRKIGARTDALDDVRGQAFLEGHRCVHHPLERLRHVARGDQNGELAQVSGERGHVSQRTLNCGSRFSTKARAVSRWSSVMPVRVWCQASRSSWSLREPDSAAFMLRFMYRRATRGPFAIFRASAIVSSSSVPSGTTRLTMPSARAWLASTSSAV